MTRLNEYGQLVGDALPGWTLRQSAEPALLEGRTCRLVRLADLDPAGRDALYAAMAAAPPALWTYLTLSGPFADRAAFDAWLEALEAYHPMIVLNPAPVGVACYLNTVVGSGSTEIGAVAFGPALQRTTAATEAIHLMLAHVFDDLGYRRVEWKCDSLNEPSRQTALRFGFLHEGLFRNAVVYKGRTRDTDWFSITAEEWPALRDAHRRWLDPANFDERGRQRVRLSELTAALWE